MKIILLYKNTSLIKWKQVLQGEKKYSKNLYGHTNT